MTRSHWRTLPARTWCYLCTHTVMALRRLLFWSVASVLVLIGYVFGLGIFLAVAPRLPGWDLLL